MGYSIRVGVFDWQKFAVDDDFYPEDLPPEWRLQYYSNEFDSACVDLDDWNPGERSCEAVEDLADNFRLAIAVSSAAALVRGGELIEHCQARPCCVIADAAPPTGPSWPASMGSLPRLSRQDLWQPAQASPVAAPIALLPGGHNPREYRHWIEQWLAIQPPDAGLTLWLDGASCDYRTLADCRQLVELMGF